MEGSTTSGLIQAGLGSASTRTPGIMGASKSPVGVHHVSISRARNGYIVSATNPYILENAQSVFSSLGEVWEYLHTLEGFSIVEL